MPYRILIADDHPFARKAIHSIFEDDELFEIIAEAENGQEAVSLCESLQPDLVLMDIHMPIMNGLEATQAIKKSYPHIKVVILSVSDDIKDLFTAIQYGAQGYLLKNLDPDDWLQYLHSLVEGKTEVSRQLAGRLLFSFREEEISDSTDLLSLTSRELEILIHIASGETNRKLAEELGISEHTVKNHIKNILGKLQLDNRVQLASFAVKHGLGLKNK